MKWNRVKHGPINGSIVDYLMGLFDEEMAKGNKLKVCIGTDSQKSGKGYKFATVIIIEIKTPMGLEKDGTTSYKGCGAMVVSTSKYEPYMGINERMIKEVEATVEVGYEIFELLDLYEIELELHADINQNPKHKSNTALNSAIGYMSGIPCKIRVKPEAYAASNGADKLCS